MSKTKLAGPQRTASVIAAIGVENVLEVYKYLKENKVERLTFEIARLGQLAAQDVEDTLDNFYQICLTRKVTTESDVGYAHNVLEKAYGPQMASSLLERAIRNLRTKVFEFIHKAGYKDIITVTQDEHPQTVVLILPHTSADQTASVIGGLPKDVRLEVIERIVTMDRTSPEIVKIVGQNLEKKFSLLMFLDFTEIGGVDHIVDITNNMDRINEKYIFNELTRKDAALCEEIRRRMLVFGNITVLDDMSIRRFLHEVDSGDLVFMLKGVNREIAETIFKNMSMRSSEGIHSDLEYTHNVRLRGVEEAQQRIIGTIHRLENEGKLAIVKGRKNEFIV